MALTNYQSVPMPKVGTVCDVEAMAWGVDGRFKSRGTVCWLDMEETEKGFDPVPGFPAFDIVYNWQPVK